MNKERWLALMSSFAFSPNIETFNKIVVCYSEGHRHYHNIAHIDECIRQLDTVKFGYQRMGEIELAIWFHDVIYNSYRKNNELKSAMEAQFFLDKQTDDADLKKRVFDLIMSTKHNNKPENEEQALIMDVDVAILGSEENIYKAYCRNVRKEYRWVPYFWYRKKRIEILKYFLNQKTLYYTEFFREKFEETARKNIEHEIFYG